MSKKVLIAEDSSVIQNLTKKILQFQNFEIIVAKNGVEVLKIVENEEISVILMDINMPVMDGMECTRRIRTLSSDKKNIPIIAITGNAKNFPEDEFKLIGINYYMQKPLNFDLLVEKVKEYA